MVSTAGLEPARVSPHAPQTCAYTDSATSTFSNFVAYTFPLTNDTQSFVRQSATSTLYNFNKIYITTKIIFAKIFIYFILSTDSDYCLGFSPRSDSFAFCALHKSAQYLRYPDSVPSHKTIHRIVLFGRVKIRLNLCKKQVRSYQQVRHRQQVHGITPLKNDT